jgi:hypothetical protein
MQMETTLPNSGDSISARTRFKWLGRKRLLFAGLALALIGTGLSWQWSWLVAIGVAPLLLSAAPCAAMCALGVCMHQMCSRSGGGTPTETSQNTSPQQEA